MPCPKYEKGCKMKDILISDALLDGDSSQKKLNVREYGAIDKTIRLFTERLCESDKNYRKCPGLIEDSLSGQWPEEDASEPATIGEH